MGKLSEKKEKIFETDIAEPIKELLLKQGYVVRSEVSHCDLVAIKDNELLIVEVKKRLNIDLLIQAVERQRMSQSVYIAVPHPGHKQFQTPKWRGMIKLLKRLEVGLIFVDIHPPKTKVEISLQPLPYQKKKSKRKTRQLLQEACSRSGDYNQAGSNKKKIMTVYREQALKLAYLLDRSGATSPRDLRNQGGPDNSQSILYNNFYGWFIRVGKGLYDLTELGKRALTDFSELVQTNKPAWALVNNRKDEVS